QDVCSVALNLYRQIVLYMSPVLPRLAEQSAALFGAPFDRWSASQAPLVGQPLQPFKHLMARVDPKQVAAMVAASVEAAPTGGGAPTPGAGAKPQTGDAKPPRAATPKGAAAGGGFEPLAPTVSFDDFAKIDLRVA